MEQVRFLLTGDTSLSVEFGNEIKESINHDIRAYKIALERRRFPESWRRCRPTVP